MTRTVLTALLTGLALFLNATNAFAQQSYTRTTIEYRAGWYPATPSVGYSRTMTRTYGYPPYGYRGRWYHHRRFERPYGPYAYPYDATYGFGGYGYQPPPVYPAFIPAMPPMPVYPNAYQAEPPPIPLSELFLVTRVTLCREDDEGTERCDEQATLARESRNRCKPILERLARKRELSRGYQIVALFRKRASGTVEATVRVSPLLYHPELTYQRLTSVADTSYHALAVFLLETEKEVE